MVNDNRVVLLSKCIRTDQLPTKLYLIKSINVDKIVFDVFTVEPKNIQSNMDNAKVIMLDEPKGTLNLRSIPAVIADASINIGRLVSWIEIDANKHKSATITGMVYLENNK